MQVIVYGPQACGKTRNAEYLMHKWKCDSIVDDWDFEKPLTENAIHLTNVKPPSDFRGAVVLAFDQAMSLPAPCWILIMPNGDEQWGYVAGFDNEEFAL